MKHKEIIEDKDVVVITALCPKCDGVVRAAVEHEMTIQTRNSFKQEVMDHELSVKKMSLEDYRKPVKVWCVCRP